VNAKALEEVFRSVGWLTSEGDYSAHVARARRTLASNSASPAALETARRIVAAADGVCFTPAPAASAPSGTADAGGEASVILGTTPEGRTVSLADVTKEGLALFSSLTKLTDIGASARDMLAELEAERLAKAAGLAKMPDLPALRAAVERGIASWTGSPWKHSVDEGIRAEIENQSTLARDRARTHPGTLGLATSLAGPGKLLKEAPAELLAKAKALGIDVNAVEGAALAVNMDPVKSLKAEVYNQELLAGDRARAAV